MSSEKEKIAKTGLEVYKSGLVAGTWGNISRRLEDDPEKFAITPSGMDYREIEPEDIPVLNLRGERVEGERKPSTEAPLHGLIYELREGVNAIVHTHSVYGSAISCTGQSIPPIIEDMVQIVGGSVETARHEMPGTDALAEAAVEALGGKNAALLANHGVVAVGESLKEALKVANIVEKSAEIYLLAKIFGEPKTFSSAEVKKLRDDYEEKYGQKD